jgi:hypothetical protein
MTGDVSRPVPTMSPAPGSGPSSGPGATASEVLATGLLARLFGASPSSRDRLPHARRIAVVVADQADFVCSTCGRTDLPEAGDWDPSICQECDAAINFDAELEFTDG